MVGIVVVSHSARLAEGVREIAEQMVQGKVAIAAAGGIDDPEHPIGTDATKVLAAIEEVYAPEGVLVLIDLGSALMSAEMAIEFLPPEQQENIRLCSAPLVEGALAAAVQASLGSDLHQVAQEALGALQVKEAQMPNAVGAPVAETGAESVTEAVPSAGEQVTLTIPNRLGLHARPAARFVATANRFDAAISVRKGSREANAKSINQIATLGARQGDDIVVTAAGPEASAALEALSALVANNLGDDDGAAAAAIAPTAPIQAAADTTEGELRGIPASPGIAVGPALQYRTRVPEVKREKSGDPEKSWQQLREAIGAARSEIEALQAQTAARGAAAEADIFSAHLLILDDPDLLDGTRAIIMGEALNAAASWQDEIERLAGQYEALEDEYMRVRAGDVRDVGNRVLRHLLGVKAPLLDITRPSIILAADLTPSDTAQFSPDMVLAVCTEGGGATSHSAILSRALGIPAVVGLGRALTGIKEGTVIGVDGSAGRVWADPAPELLEELHAKREAWLREQAEAKARGQEEAVTADGHRVEIAANIGGPHDVDIALDYGAEGIGLFRTEFLFLERESAPTEEEQYEAYRHVARKMGQKPVIIRTLDVGGDKPIPYLEMAEEANPFLGWRGIRFCLDHPDLFVPQLRAIVRAAEGHNVKVMFPMVSTIEEVRAARRLLDRVTAELKEDAIAHAEHIEVGIMIEVPAAVAIADQLADEVDFFSIGTNDLTQYTMAADRGNRRVAQLAQALQPAVLRLIAQTVDAAHKAGIWVGLCGELGGNASVASLLLGLGLDELSMNAPSIPTVKGAVRNVTMAAAKEVANVALAQYSVQEVEEAVAKQPTA